MNRPLWRIFLNVLMLAFVAQRGGVLAMAVMAHASPLLIAALAVQCAAGLFAAIAIWIGRFMERSLVVLGLTLVLGAAVQIAALGPVAMPGVFAQTMAAVLAIGGLIFLLHHVQREEE